MTKQEKIQEAYGQHWEIVKDYVDNNGQCDKLSLFKFTNLRYNDFDCLFIHTANNYMLPKSLQGIEDNNGWIKIESENDLPNDEMDNYWLSNGDHVYNYVYSSDEIEWEYKSNPNNFTHYQPIKKPLKPLY